MTPHPKPPDTQRRKAYIVEHVGWAVKQLLVYAASVTEATDLARAGEGECIDTDVGSSHYRRAHREPNEDR